MQFLVSRVLQLVVELVLSTISWKQLTLSIRRYGVVIKKEVSFQVFSAYHSIGECVLTNF